MEYSAVLGADEVLSDKPFTDAAYTMREVDVMRHMLLHERERALQWIDIDPGSHIIREYDDEGHRHLIVIPDTRRLLETENLTAVGVCGGQRDDVDHGILFATPDVPPEWHRDEVHKRAVSVSPGHYHHVRLHKGSILGKLHDGGDIRVERTKYFDFDTGNGTWFGLRLFQD